MASHWYEPSTPLRRFVLACVVLVAVAALLLGAFMVGRVTAATLRAASASASASNGAAAAWQLNAGAAPTHAVRRGGPVSS